MVCEMGFSGTLWTPMLKWLEKDGFQKAGEKSRGKWAVAIEEAALEAGSSRGGRIPVSAVRAESLTNLINHLFTILSLFNPFRSHKNPLEPPRFQKVGTKWGHLPDLSSVLRQ